MLKFKIKSQSARFNYLVYIHEDLDHLRSETKKFNKKTGSIRDNDDKILGIVHTQHRWKVYPNKQEKLRSNLGIVRLSKMNLTPEIVSHELIHAALWIYRNAYGTEREFDIDNTSDYNADFGDNNSKDEETFAYIYGELFEDLIKHLRKNNIFPLNWY